MIDLLSLIFGFLIGFFVGVLVVYIWIRRYIMKFLRGEKALEDIINLLQKYQK